MSKKVLIMAGGTGGHIFPALAIAKELHRQGQYDELYRWATQWQKLDRRDIDAIAFLYEALYRLPDQKIEGLEGLKREWWRFPYNSMLTRFYYAALMEQGLKDDAKVVYKLAIDKMRLMSDPEEGLIDLTQAFKGWKLTLYSTPILTSDSDYENYVNFSSAERRLDNFKYKVKLIDGYKAESSSLVGVNYAGSDLREFDKKIRNIKANFDGYEDYLYNVSSSYITSSLGEFPTASWPKTGSGTFAIPFEPVSRSHADFITWYGSVASKRGQIYSASYYDQNNPNRLVNLLPEHVKDDAENNQFLDFIDMIGQQFDEVWAYTSEIAKITDRQNDLSKGFSSDLVFNLAKSLGWDVQDGKDLLDLSRAGFGQKVSGSGVYSLYTSGSIGFQNITDGTAASLPEADVSKEITKRLICHHHCSCHLIHSPPI